MNYTETFNDFANRIGPTDLALYAGAALVLYVLFKDRMSPVQKVVSELLNKAKSFLSNKNPVVPNNPLVSVDLTKPSVVSDATDDLFFKLVVSWKQTRDLATQLKCEEAVKVIDQMFPYLSPSSCKENVNL